METLTMETWDATIAGLDSGKIVQVDQEVFDYFLEVLPPKSMGRRVWTPEGPVVTAFGFAEGTEAIRYFWRNGDGNYFAWCSGEIASGD